MLSCRCPSMAELAPPTPPPPDRPNPCARIPCAYVFMSICRYLSVNVDGKEMRKQTTYTMESLYPTSHRRKKAAKERNHRKFGYVQQPNASKRHKYRGFRMCQTPGIVANSPNKNRGNTVNFTPEGKETLQIPRILDVATRNNNSADAKGTSSVGNDAKKRCKRHVGFAH